MGVTQRIGKMRKLFRENLEEVGAKGSWNHVTDQIGMFSYTGLNEAQCDKLIQEHHIYLMRSGRISVSGLNAKNMDYVVDCIDKVVREG